MPADAVAGTTQPVEPAAPSKSPDTSTAKSRILIVDDHEDNIEVLRVRLDSWGYETAAAYNGAEALSYVEQTPPDLILLDVMMPEMDGNEVARRIKANKALPFIPI